MVKIIGQRRHMHQSFHRVWKFYIESPLLHAGDNALKHLTNTFFHIFYFFEFICLALRLICSPLHLAGMFCNLRQNTVIMFDPFLVHPAAQVVLDDPVDLQIRVTADR